MSAWIALSVTSAGDYPGDAGPAVHALAHGDVSTYLATHAMMGPFATIVQAPFAALAQGGLLSEYRWACFPCLLAAGLLGLYLAALAGRRGASIFGRWLISALCLVNPLTFEALRSGHPEEILTAALAVGAVAVASDGREVRAAILLGLAVASKQWAVVAILPVLMALPARRVRAATIAAGLVLILLLPGLLAAPDSFVSAQGNAASTGHVVDPWNVWYPLADITTKVVVPGPQPLIAQVHEAPPLVGALSHPLIVLLTLAVPLALALRRNCFALSGADAMALLALLSLLRCVLDPVGNLYYHEPLLLALIGWDAFSARGLPLRSFLGTVLAAFFWRWSHSLTDPDALNAAYIVVMAAASVMIGMSLFQGGARSERRTFVAGVRSSSEDRSHASAILSGVDRHFLLGRHQK